MNEEYLRRGIIGLARTLSNYAHSSFPPWFGGHYACAVIAAYYFCRDNQIDAYVQHALCVQLDRMMKKYDQLFLPLEKGAEDETLISIDDILCSLGRCVSLKMVSGHHVIYTAYAIQALRDRPDMMTPTVMQGIYDLVNGFNGRADGIDPRKAFDDGGDRLPKYGDEDEMVNATFDGLCSTAVLADQGRILFQGHAMTWAHALVTLSRLGFPKLAEEGYDAQRLYLEEAVRFDPGQMGEKVTTNDHPFSHRFWSKDFEALDRDWEYGHVFKYLYSFYDLIERVPDAAKRQECERRLLYLI